MARTLLFILLLPVALFAGAADSLWLRLYDGPSANQYNQSADVYYDTAGGFIYVCGGGENDTWPGLTNMLTAKYTDAGQFLWSRTYGGNTTSQDDMANAIAVDAAGNVYVAGLTNNTLPRGYDISYIKYSPTGQQLWARKTLWEGDDAAYDLVVGPDGYIYMCGIENRTTALPTGFLLMKVSPTNGDTVWTRSYILDTTAFRDPQRVRDFHPEFFEDFDFWDNCATALAVAPDGDIVVTGFGLDYQNELEREMWTMKFGTDGTRRWEATYHHPTTIYHDDDAAFAVVVSRFGQIYIAGFDYFETGADWQDYNFAVVQYGSDGTRLNFRSINVAAEDGADFATAITLDDSTPQNVYVTGMLAYPAPLNEEMATFKFGPDLSYRWGPAGALYGGNSDDVGYGITYRRGRVYCVGRRGMDLAAVGYTADNVQPKDTLWTWTYNNPANLEDYAAAIAVKDTTRIIVVGQAQRAANPGWTSLAVARLAIFNRDLALARLYEPQSGVALGDTVIPRALIRNPGNTSADWRAVIRIGTGYADTAYSTGQLRPLDSIAVTFRPWVADAPGVFATRCSVATIGDRNPANDFIDRAVTVSARDVGCVRIITPTGPVPLGAEIRPLALLYNYGTDPERFTAKFTIGDGYSRRINVDLPPDDSTVVEFDPWTASQPGQWVVACTTELDGDGNPANDRAADFVNVQADYDVGVTVIVAPVGTVDSGTLVTPEATVRNWGINPAAFAVHFSVDPFYADSFDVGSLEPGDSLRVTFEPFTATTPGNYSSVCRTAFDPDQNPANDTLSAPFRIVGAGGPSLDVGVTLIVSPGAQVDSGSPVTPQVMVRNYTSSAVETPVHFLIRQRALAKDAPGRFVGKRVGTDQLYHDSATVQLGPDEETPVNFAQWVASPCETLLLQAFTALDGDENPANDSQAGQTVVLPPVQGSDVGVIAIVAPPDTVDSGAVVTPTLRVRNFGSRAETFPVSFEIEDGYSDETSIMLDPGDSVDVTFTQWEASQNGTFAKRGWTALAGDVNPANDTLAGTVTVRGGSTPVRDVGAIAIVAPPDTVDSGTVVTPTLRVKNFGTRPETFPVRFEIEDGYFDETSVMLDPGDSVEVTFMQWEASQNGTFAKRGWTALEGDRDPHNDTVAGTVTVRGGSAPGRDVGAIAIVAPPDTVDSGEVIRPTLRVKNFGAGTEMVPVRFEIEDGYFAETDIVLGPGVTTEVIFDPWTANQTGTFAMRGWTQLDGDENPANDTMSGSVTVLPGTGIEELAPLPVAFAASHPLPNPTRGRTTIRLALPQAGAVSLRVFDACGQLVATPAQTRLGAGRHQLHWDGRDNSGRTVAPGTYYLRLEAGTERSLSRVTILAR
ncbi:MAG: FlgD immunoglobulin-like domain containing protein [bacterium]